MISEIHEAKKWIPKIYERFKHMQRAEKQRLLGIIQVNQIIQRIYLQIICPVRMLYILFKFRSKITKNGGCWTGIIPINVHFEALWLAEIELRLNWIRLKALWRRIPNCLQSSTLLNTGLFVRISSKQWMIRFYSLLLQNKLYDLFNSTITLNFKGDCGSCWAVSAAAVLTNRFCGQFYWF